MRKAHIVADSTKLKKTTRVEEDPRHTTVNIDTNNLLISGTDYGIVTKATTVTHTLEDMEKLQFQFQRRLQRVKAEISAGRETSLTEAILAHKSLASAMTVQKLNGPFSQARSKASKLLNFCHHPQIERERQQLQWRQSNDFVQCTMLCECEAAAPSSRREN
ncbi:hypothetical protein DM01DRAFT_1377973 [Hesseltinella vesiculosa]|uniref:Uncharacterized protein n=1 Tax=Hesseltinella vesiculosa TaxID=101127 RepID=A0A1X2G6R8_9FUNG|nr:hypothetical protein DM01DRAFT_1377973 [Hesseltinella vesiculosa]